VLTPLFFAGSALAQESERFSDENSYVSFTGSVLEQRGDEIKVDHGNGFITVEVDDFDLDKDAAPIEVGDTVTVYGYVDTDPLEQTTIEATSVYVKDLNAIYYASGIDEETGDAAYAYPDTVEGPSDATFTGKVLNVEGREFVLQMPSDYTLEVDTVEMAFNPLDNSGLVQVDEGDIVTASGKITDSLFDNSELTADSVVVRKETSEEG
jgi:hypothetical protein